LQKVDEFITGHAGHSSKNNNQGTECFQTDEKQSIMRYIRYQANPTGPVILHPVRGDRKSDRRPNVLGDYLSEIDEKKWANHPRIRMQRESSKEKASPESGRVTPEMLKRREFRLSPAIMIPG